MPRPPDTTDDLIDKLNSLFGGIVDVDQTNKKAIATTYLATTAAGLGTAIYLVAKARWLAAALTLFIGGPAATVAAVAAVAALTKKRV